MPNNHISSAKSGFLSDPATKYLLVASLAITGILLSSDVAMAQRSPMGNIICMVLGMIYGNLGRGLAILAVIILGVGATIGKVSWGLALTVATGIGTIFGAVSIAAYLISGNPGTPMCGGVGGID